MTKYYSATTGGFYASDVHEGNMPPDATEITDAYYTTLFDGQSLGKRIVTASDGTPVLEDPAAPTNAALLASCKAVAKQLLLDTDYSQVADVAATLKNLGEFVTYRAAVRELMLNPVANPVWPTPPVAVW